jgi:hypothetical protein
MKKRMAIAALAILIGSLAGSQWAHADFDVERDAFSIAGGRGAGGQGTFSVYQIAGQPVAGVGTGSDRLHHSGYLPVILEYVIDLAPPQLAVGVLAGTVTPTYLAVYVSSSEILGASATGKFTLTRSGGEETVTDEVLEKLEGHDAIYYTQYQLLYSGLLEMVVTGSDVYGNEGNITRYYNVESISASSGFELASSDGAITVSGKSGSVTNDGFILLDPDPVLTDASDGKGIALAAAGERPEKTESLQIGGAFRLFATVALAGDVEISVGYDPALLAAVDDPEFDERKVGLYRLSGRRWEYVGGESDRHRVSAQNGGLGVYSLRYNSEHTILPSTTELYQNYPNPFNPTTTIRFGLADDGPVRLTIYNVQGQRVRTLVDEVKPAGYHTYTWNGRNDNGGQVATGVYLCRFEAGENAFTKKMVLLK